MTEDLRYRTSGPAVVSETVDDETIIVNLDTGAYYDLNPVGACIWMHVESGRSVGETADEVVRRFGADETEVNGSVVDFVGRLVEEGLITEIGQGIDPPSPNGTGRSGLSEGLPYVPPAINKHRDMQELLLLDPIHEVDEAGWPVVAAEPGDG